MKNFKAHAVLCLSNNGGLEIMINESCDGVFFRFYGGEILEADIESIYNIENDEFENAFIHNENIYFLNQFTKVN